MRELVGRFTVHVGGCALTDLAFVAVICASFAQFVNSLVEDITIPIIPAVAAPFDIARLIVTTNNSAFPYSAFMSSLMLLLVVAHFVSGLNIKPMTWAAAWVTPHAGEMQAAIRLTASAGSSWMPGRIELRDLDSKRAVARYLNATPPFVGE